MKIDAAHLHFAAPFLPSPGRKRPWFIGGRNTIQLLETALVIEGYRKRLGLPVVDLFFQQALSERTMLTIPYSRIGQYRYSRRWGWRIFWTILSWLPLLFPLALLAGRDPDPAGAVAFAVPLLFLGVVLTLYVNLRVLRGHNVLLFLEPDGRQALLRFRIRPRKLQQAFQKLLESNRKAAAEMARSAVVE
jgi:hypothetical protein